MLRIAGKKGIVFTIVAIVISAIVIAAFFFTQEAPIDQDVQSVKQRVSSVNNYLSQLDGYVSYLAGAQTRQGMELAINEMVNENDYYPSFEEQIKQCLISGNMDRLGPVLLPIYCPDYFYGTLHELDTLAKNELNINSNITVTGIGIVQTSPWYVTTIVNLTVEVNDSYAYWKVNKTIYGNASIIGLTDPTSTNFLARPVPRRAFTAEIPFNGWMMYPSTLNRYGYSDYYFQYRNAPSFLQRMNNQLSSDGGSLGIATLVMDHTFIDPDVSHLDYTFNRHNVCGERELIAFDFFSELNTVERSRLNVSEVWDESINMLVVPLELLNVANMSNTRFYDELAIACT